VWQNYEAVPHKKLLRCSSVLSASLDAFLYATLRIRTSYAHTKQRIAQVQRIFDERAKKKPTNLSINSDLLSKAKGLNINLSATLEHALETEVRAAEKK